MSKKPIHLLLMNSRPSALLDHEIIHLLNIIPQRSKKSIVKTLRLRHLIMKKLNGHKVLDIMSFNVNLNQARRGSCSANVITARMTGIPSFRRWGKILLPFLHKV